MQPCELRGRHSHSDSLQACVFMVTVFLEAVVQLRKNRFFPVFQKSEAAGARAEATLRPEHSSPTASCLRQKVLYV